MAEKEKIDVKYLSSVALAIRDIHDEIRHVQITIVQEYDSEGFRAYFDIVDPSKIKLQDNELSEPGNT